MANSILKLKVESEEYNAKLKEAAKGLQHLAEVAHRGAGEMTGLDKSEIEFIKSLGDMETKSRSAAGSVRELEKTYKDLALIYKNLSDIEKEDEGGKALAASLERLKERFMEGKAQMAEVNKELSGGGGLKDALDAVAGKFGLSIDQVTKFGGALAVTGTAVKVAKDAFFASEATVDEWGRTVASAESVYEGFLNALNNMDISGFLSRIDEIVTAARAAYNELDRLGTMKTIQAPQISAQQTENDRIRMMIQTGRYIGSLDGRREIDRETGNVMQSGQQLNERQIKVLEQKLTEGTQKVVDLVSNEVKQTTAAIDAVYKRQGAELGMSVKEFRKGTSSMAEFEKRLAGAEKYNQYESQHTNTVYNPATGGWSQKRDNTANPYEQYKGWDVFRVDGDRYKQLVQLIQQRDQQAAQAYSMQSQAYRAINRAEGTTVRDIMNGGSAGKGGSGGGATTAKETYVAAEGSIDAQAEKVRELTKLWSAAADQAGRDGYKKQLDEAQAVLDQMRGKVKDVTQEMATGISGLTPEMLASGQADIKKQMQTVELGSEEYNNLADRLIDYNAVSNLLQESVKSGLQVDDDTRELFANALLNGELIPQEVFDAFVESLNEFRELAGENPIVLNIETGQVTTAAKRVMTEAQKTQQAWNLASQSVNNMGNALNAIDDPAAKAAGTVIKAIADIALGFAQASKAADTTASGWAWLAWLAAGTAAMATTISTVHSLTGFANGGIVQGNSYSGDNVGPVMLDAGEVVLNRAQSAHLAEQLEGDRGESVESVPYVTGEMIYLGLNNYLKANGYGEMVTSQR